MNRRKFLVNGLLAGAGTTGLLGASAQAENARSQNVSRFLASTSQIVNTDGVRLDTALYGLAQSALPADRIPVSGVVPTVTRHDWSAGSAITPNMNRSPAETRMLAGRLVPSPNYPYDYESGGSASYVTGQYEGGNATCEWMMDGSQCEIAAVGRGGGYQVLVDGVASGSYDRLPSDGNFFRIRIDFNGSRAIRRITLQAEAGFGFWFLTLGGNDTLWKSPRQLGPRCIVLGDSFTEGTGAASGATAFPAVFGKAMGFEDTWASGSGGTGYISNASGSGLTRYTFRQRVASDVIAYKPQIVVIAGGINDGPYSSQPSTPAQVQAEAILLYRQIIAALPTVRLYVCGPWQPPVTQNSVTDSIKTALQAAVAAVPGVTFLDVSGYYTGTGHVGGETGAGNSDLYVGPDHVHPTAAGHLYLGSRLAADFAATQPF